MPTFEITAPDGRKFRVTGPEGSTQEQALQRVQSQYQASQPQPFQPVSPEVGGVGEQFLAGAGKAFVDIGRGAQQLGARVMAPYAAPFLNADQTERRRLEAPLMEQPAAVAGNIVGNIALTAPALAIPGAATLPGAALAGASLGALQPAASGGEAVTNAALGGALGAAGQGIGQKVAQFAQGRRAASQAAALADVNPVREATLKSAQSAGYVVPPTAANPTLVNRALESVSGKAATQQSAALRNQKVTNRLVREELGLPAGSAVSRESLKEIREKAGSVYRAFKNAGEVASDAQYMDDLAGIEQSIAEVAKDFPDANVGANEQIQQLVDSLLVDKFNASSGVEFVKQLRKAASGNLSGVNAADPSKRALGAAQRDAAAALEDRLIRHLNETGRGEVAKEFDRARTLIAKTYSVEGALDGSNVNARMLGNQLKRGKPLSGNLGLVARFAQEFPDAAIVPKASMGLSAVDALVGGGGVAVGAPGLLAVPAARYAARGTVLSGPYQRAMTTAGAPKNPLLALLEQSKRGGLAPAVGFPLIGTE